jgi:hypothetical protein
LTTVVVHFLECIRLGMVPGSFSLEIFSGFPVVHVPSDLQT